MPCSASERMPSRMNAIAASMRATAAFGSGAVETLSPAADMAPKKIRLKVCFIASSSS